MAIDCSVVDAGGRYGLHPTWQELRGIANFHMFEIAADEALPVMNAFCESGYFR